MMPGNNTLTINSLVVAEAIKQYLSSTQFKAGAMPDIVSIEVKSDQYNGDWSLVIKLAEKVAPAPNEDDVAF